MNIVLHNISISHYKYMYVRMYTDPTLLTRAPVRVVGVEEARFSNNCDARSCAICRLIKTRHSVVSTYM